MGAPKIVRDLPLPPPPVRPPESSDFNRASTAFDIESIVSDVADVTSCVDHTKGSVLGGGGIIDPATKTKLCQEGEDNQLNQITAKIKGKNP